MLFRSHQQSVWAMYRVGWGRKPKAEMKTEERKQRGWPQALLGLCWFLKAIRVGFGMENQAKIVFKTLQIGRAHV